MAQGILHLALLRGINVGGKNKLPMKALASIFVDAGCQEVQTYIQSGNVLFQATKTRARTIPTQVNKAILAQFEFDIPVVMRTVDELKAVAEDNPFLHQGADTKALHVAFLAKKPTPSKVEQLDPHRSPPDTFILRGKEIYLHCPGGLARTKLTSAYFDKKLDTISTIRNWNTILKLIARSS